MATISVIVGIIMVVIVASIIVTQTPATLGGQLPVTILSFVTTVLALALVVKAFDAVG